MGGRRKGREYGMGGDREEGVREREGRGEKGGRRVLPPLTILVPVGDTCVCPHPTVQPPMGGENFCNNTGA